MQTEKTFQKTPKNDTFSKTRKTLKSQKHLDKQVFGYKNLQKHVILTTQAHTKNKKIKKQH